ncbi:SDR family NAD(P)-dependent oxidoreductase [Bradyrhizobium manausense]
MTDTAVVTGASSGIGARAAVQLAEAGYNVLGIDVADAAQGGVTYVKGDISDTNTWDQVDEALGERGWVPSVFVAAAAYLKVGTVLDLDESAWRRTFDVNVGGLIKALRRLLPGMIERRRGSIVTVGSIDSFMAEQGLVSYCASKGAILQLTKVLALDHARDGIRANCVCPGVTDTPFFRRHLDTAVDPTRFLRAREQRNPLGRLLDPDEVARAIVFLASDSASGITGAQIVVDAGLTAGFDFRTGEEGS